MKTAKLSSWTVLPGKGYNSRPFWEVVRYNSTRPFGREYVCTRTGSKRYYDKAKAEAAAAKLNEAPT